MVGCGNLETQHGVQFRGTELVVSSCCVFLFLGGGWLEVVKEGGGMGQEGGGAVARGLKWRGGVQEGPLRPSQTPRILQTPPETVEANHRLLAAILGRDRVPLAVVHGPDPGSTPRNFGGGWKIQGGGVDRPLLKPTPLIRVILPRFPGQRVPVVFGPAWDGPLAEFDGSQQKPLKGSGE